MGMDSYPNRSLSMVYHLLTLITLQDIRKSWERVKLKKKLTRLCKQLIRITAAKLILLVINISIDFFPEFVMATINREKMLSKNRLLTIFKIFDKVRLFY